MSLCSVDWLLHHRATEKKMWSATYAVRGVSMKAVILVLSGISECPGYIAGIPHISD